MGRGETDWGPVVREALWGALLRLDPRNAARNPVMFLVWVGTLLCLGFGIRELASGDPEGPFTLRIAFWLAVTVGFANFAEALAEGRGKAQARALRDARSSTRARRVLVEGFETVDAGDLRRGDRVVVEAGEIIPGDGEILEGVASVDESAVTGESAPVIRESGGDRSSVTGGTRVLSDRLLIRISADPGDAFMDRMIRMIEGARRRKTPNETALHVLLVGLSLIFLAAVATLAPFGLRAGVRVSPTVLIALLVCLIPTTIGGLLSAIGIAGMDRLLRRNVLALSGRAVEAAGDVGVLLLDKTGTITLGNRMASEFLPAPGVWDYELAEAALWASLADETPEGRSLVSLARHQFGLKDASPGAAGARFVPFSASTRMSGVDLPERSIRKGAMEAIARWVEERGGSVPGEVHRAGEEIARAGGTPLAVAEGDRVLGVVRLRDVVKGGIRERFADLRRMGIRTVMITGDNPLTAAAVAAEAGVDDFVAEATPETKLGLIRSYQQKGWMVAMTGDGTNDAPALAQADVGVAMNSGTQAAKEAGNMVDLDSSPTKLIDIVETGKALLMTRGALTTFSVANDVAKYFAILPALFGGAFPVLEALNVMRLGSPRSAIESAVIFNALILLLLIPLALRGVRYRPMGAAAILRRNLTVYGLGGVLAPFAGIKAIDLILSGLGRL